MPKTQQHIAKQISISKRFKRSDSDPQLSSSRNIDQDSNIDENEEFFDAEESLEENHMEVDPRPGTSNQAGKVSGKRPSAKEQDKSAQKKEEKAKEKLTIFIKTFINDFTIMLAAHHVASKDRVKSEELKTSLKKELTSGVSGGITGALLGKAISNNLSGIIPSAVASTRAITSFLNTSDQKNAQKITKAFENVPKGKLGEILSEAAGEIFHSFESQFMSLTDKASDKIAMERLASNSAYRALNYIARFPNHDISSEWLAEGVVSSNNPEFVLEPGQGLSNTFKKTFHTPRLQDNRGNHFSVSDLYENTGIVVNEGTYNHYFKKNGMENSYRLPLPFEQVGEIKDLLTSLENRGFVKVTDTEERERIEETQYMNILQPREIEEESKRILKEIEEAKPATRGDVDRIPGQVAEIVGRQASKQSSKDIKFDLIGPVENFIGREEELETLHEKLGQGVTAITQKISGLSTSPRASVSGLGGIGKTQLAREYAKRYSQEYDNNIMWINAENELSISGSFERLASKLGIAKKDVDGDKKKTHDLAQEIYEHFGEAKSLFIFDNIENYDEIKEYLPKELVGNKPSILITSRYRNWKNIKVLDLDVFTDEEAKEFIKQELDINDNSQDEEVERLATKLGKLPLALAQAVAYIKQSQIINRVFGVSDYLEKYNEKLENVKALLGNQALRGSNDPYTETVLTTWKVTLDKIRAETYGEKAIEILNIMAYFNPENIPNEMFVKLTDEEVPQRTLSIMDSSSNQILSGIGNSERISSAIQLLQSYSMINQGIAQDRSNVYRLVQKVIRIGLKQEGKEKDILNKANILIEKFRPTTDRTLSTSYEEYSVLLKAAKLQYGTQTEKSALISEVLNNIRLNGDINLLRVFLDQLQETIDDKADYLSYLSTALTCFIKRVPANSDTSVNFATEVISYIKNAEVEKKITKVDLLGFFERKYNMVNIYPGVKEESTIDELISHLLKTTTGDQDQKAKEQERLKRIAKEIESIREGGEELEKLKGCAIQGRGRRKKRSAENECSFNSKDVDEFNEAEEQDRRDPNKIKINSEKFIEHLKDAYAEKQDQLIELADHVEVTGSAKESVGGLVKHHKLKSHLQKVSKLSGQINSALMAKNIGADIINGDYKDVAVNGALIGGGEALGKASDKILAKGVALEADKKLLGGSLKAASPFLRRGTAGFFAYDLIQSIKGYKSGDKDALDGIVTNAIFVGVDLAQAGVEAAEFLEVMAGVAEFTGPIGEAIVASVFLGKEIYEGFDRAEKRVDELEKHVHLTRGEELWEGLRAAVGLNPSEEIKERMEVKEHHNQSVKKAIEFLKRNTDFARYVFPVMEEKEQFWLSYREWSDNEIEMFNSVDGSHRRFNADRDQNKTKKFNRMVSNNARLIRKMNLYTSNHLSFSVYNRTFPSVPDSSVDLIKRSRCVDINESAPDEPKEGKLLCKPGKEGSKLVRILGPTSNSIYMIDNPPSQYLCENAIGVEYNVNRTGNNTLIALGEGRDTAIGTPDSPNVFIVNNGHKNYTGGNEGVTFIAQGTSMTGTLSGGGGIDTLDFRGFEINNGEFALLDSKGVLCSKKNQVSKSYIFTSNGIECTNSLSTDNIEQVYGRKDKKDVIFLNKHSEYIDGLGGKSSQQQDEVRLKITSNKNPTIILRPYTKVFYGNPSGFIDSVSYIVPRGEKGEASVYPFFNISIQHRFHFDCPISSLRGINVGEGNITFNLFDQQKEFNVTISNLWKEYMSNNNNTIKAFPSLPRNASYTFQDGEVKILNRNNFYAEQNTNKTVEEIISEYPEVANRLNMTMLFKLPNNETVLVGHGAHEIMHNNPSYTSHLVGNGGENVYKIVHGSQEFSLDELPIPGTVIYDVDEENSIDTIDLRDLMQKKPNGTEFHGPQVLISEEGNDLILSSFLKSQNNETREYFEVVLKDGVNWSHNVDVVINGSHMKIDFNGTNYQLKPLPLAFKSDYRYIVIQPSDIEKENEIIIEKEVDNYTFARLSNDLIITNAFDQDLKESKYCTIILKDLYLESKMRTLSIKFVDKEIILKDHTGQINNATNFDALQKEHNKIRNTILNITDSQESTTTVNPEITRHRHRHHHGQNATAHQRSRRAISVDGVSVNNNDPVFFVGQNDAITGIEHEATNGAARPSSLINDLFSWVKSSVGGLFNSKAALPEKTLNGTTQSSLSQVDAQVDVDGTIMLFDLLIRKITGQEHISHDVISISEQEAHGYALNITEKFEKVVEQAALKSGISMHRLNIDSITIQKEITKKVMSGKFDEIAGILKLNIEKACPGGDTGCPGKLSQKKFDTFITTFNDEISVALNQSTQQISHRNSPLEVKEQQEPKSHLSNIFVQGHLTQAKAKLIS